jgi:hypothetical protein
MGPQVCVHLNTGLCLIKRGACLSSLEIIFWGLPVKMTSTNACVPIDHEKKACQSSMQWLHILIVEWYLEICSFCRAAFADLAVCILILLK